MQTDLFGVGKQVANFSSNVKDAAVQALAQAEGLLTFLRAHGAILLHLHPELLLDVEDLQCAPSHPISTGSLPPCMG